MVRCTKTFTLDAAITRRLAEDAERLHISHSELCNQLLQEAMAERDRTTRLTRTIVAGVGTAALTIFLTTALLVA